MLGTPLWSDRQFYDIGSMSSSSRYSLSQLFPATWPPRGDDVTSRRSVASSARRTSVMRSRSSGWRRQHPVITRLTSGGQQRGGSGESPDWTRWITWPHAPTHHLCKSRPEITKNNSIESADIEMNDRWLHSTVGRTPVFGRRTDPVLYSACSRRVTSMWVNRPLQVSQLGQLSLLSFRGR